MKLKLLIMMVIALPMANSAKCPTKCRCHSGQNAVYCTNMHLTRFPQGMRNDTRELYLRGNDLTEVTPDDVVTVPDLRVLYLADNRIAKITSGTLESMPRLARLDLSGNPYSPSRVASEVVCELQKVKIEVLMMERLNLSYDRSLFICLTRLRLTKLSLSANKLENLPDYAFSGLHWLEFLNLANAVGSNFNPVSLSGLGNLHYLNLSTNLLKSFPQFEFHDKPILPRLVTLRLDFNLIAHIPARSGGGLQSLKKLSLADNSISTLDDDGFSRFSKLESLDLSYNRMKHIAEYSFNISTLKELRIRKNKYKLNRKNNKFLHHSPNLRKLSLMETSLYYMLQPISGRDIFGNLSKLEELNILSTGLARLPIGVFDKLHQLKKLVLSENTLGTLPTGIFKSLIQLESLYLNTNRLTSVSKSWFPIDSHLKSVYLGRNPFACTCNLLWFAEWLKTTNVTVLGRHRTYLCYSPPQFLGTSLYDFPIREEDCHIEQPNITLIVSVSLTGFAALIIVTVLASYRCRWNIRYLYFSLKARIRQYRETQDDREYLYDGFLAYNNQDLPWVRQHLLPALEEEGGLQLCLHDRNWLPGVDIMDNIVTSIENSRKTVMVVSNAFASSQWCQLELTMAQHRLFEKDRNNLVLILLEDIDPGNMTPRLALQMRSRTYVQWTEDPMGQRLFWKKLNRTLMKPDRRVLQNPYAITT